MGKLEKHMYFSIIKNSIVPRLETSLMVKKNLILFYRFSHKESYMINPVGNYIDNKYFVSLR